MNFNFYEVLLPIALILSLSKLLEIGFRKINIPQVIAMLLAGVLIGLVNYIPNQEILLPSGVAGFFLSYHTSRRCCSYGIRLYSSNII